VSDASDAVTDRPPGRRGQLTRRRLLDATMVLLETLPYRDVKVVDIAREAGTSPATFYQYFSDVEEAVLAIADEMASAVGPLLASLVSWMFRHLVVCFGLCWVWFVALFSFALFVFLLI
jgi:AcrR family transcriptional regulator